MDSTENKKIAAQKGMVREYEEMLLINSYARMLEETTKEISAFKSWPDLYHACKDHGYVPTIDRNRSPFAENVAEALENSGFSVFRINYSEAELDRIRRERDRSL